VTVVFDSVGNTSAFRFEVKSGEADGEKRPVTVAG